MNKSESIKELATALAKAQAVLEGAIKDKTNPHFRSKYADLGNVVDALKVLGPLGISYVQICHEKDSAACVETIIMHESGEWMSCGPVAVPVSKQDAQGYGSAMTYARRYSLSAAFGVAPEDDDGNAAAKAKPAHPMAASGPHLPTSDVWDLMTDAQKARLTILATKIKQLLSADNVEAAQQAYESGNMDADEKVALWSRFDSKERSALKGKRAA